ncbi:Glycosyltransferase involved in cell wall bisynthesis [Anaerosporobacter mobilis DSM 15930]|uniref:Glycosyltransferase involved in cell wall bisynthesis n=1 Tax=Anaerosporobacter mobilis DSM 15930 TaxID=1120996 RepID=A0A1M7LCY9_9FIRM|nr:glycosyltransferase [Anaerosporobacter mobilis]SHM75969.1 Glycosyltransferase involved in cell wall bisynthesis [Anaerosporobacter mobilis DSM 15930]
MNSKINSKEYWNNRFETNDWDINMGREQSTYFYELMTDLLPEWLKLEIKQQDYSIIDMGCAEGQGVPILSQYFGKKIVGVDFSNNAIQIARNLYPDYEFEVGDINEREDLVDITIMSNILEHFHQPFDTLKKVSKYTKEFILVQIPFMETNLMPEHHYTFKYNNIPISIGDFKLICYKEYDCTEKSNGLFLGKQILLIYSANDRLNKSLSIDDMCGVIHVIKDKISEIQNLNIILEEKSKEVNLLVDKKFTVENCIRNLEEHNYHIVDENLCSVVKYIEDNSNKMSKALQRLVENTRYIENLEEKLDKSDLKLKEQDRNISSLNNQINELHEINAKYMELVNRFNNLNDAYGFTVQEYSNIKNSRTWRVATMERELARKLGLVRLAKGCLDIKHLGIRGAIKKRKYKKSVGTNLLLTSDLKSKSAQSEPLMEHVNHLNSLYQNVLNQPLSEVSLKLRNILASKQYKGIIVYPHAVKWEPIQRPQHILREFARAGYLTIFCENNQFEHDVYEPYNNVLVVRGEENLLPLIQDKHVIILCTYFLQTIFSNLVPNKTLWFDILDRLEFFASYCEYAQRVYDNLILNADILTYSADNLKIYTNGREDAVLLKNAVNVGDFAITEVKKIEKLEHIKNTKEPIIGYYGAIEEWFDIQSVQYLAENYSCQIVLIGHVGIDTTRVKNKNIHFLGKVPYNELKYYAKYFDVALIPFIVNDLTNAVSPVKFFEYAANGIPVVSSDIHEMNGYTGKAVQIYRDKEELVKLVRKLSSCKIEYKDELQKIADSNTWTARTNEIMNLIYSDIKALRHLANITAQGSVCVQTVTFFKYDGTTYYSGGAERYLLDLCEVCKQLNIKYRIYQYAEYNWVRFYGNVEVIGIVARETDVNMYGPKLVSEMYRHYENILNDQAAVSILSPFYLLPAKSSITTIGISHGISWDSEFNHLDNGTDFWNVNKSFIEGAKLTDYMVSVDTNTANWFQTINYDISRKIKYIPNYVDNEEFCPGHSLNENKIVITYPRRLYGARGLYITLDVVDDILTKYPNAEFHFVGKGFEQDTKHVEEKIKKWGDRVKWYSKAPNEMHEVYKITDIALIPTMYSEGTSLSCLEALSSGNAVISTRIGGLTDLILSDYNGMLIEPDGNSLLNALEELLSNPEKMKKIRANAIETAKAFSKNKWITRWKEVIQNATKDSDCASYQEEIRCIIELKDKKVNDFDVIKLIQDYLVKGYYVYIKLKKNKLRYDSYNRLQFIDWDENIYFEPDIYVVERNHELIHIKE